MSNSLLKRITAEECAQLELAQGAKLVKIQGVWWRQVRPLFFRPLLQFKEYAFAPVAPRLAWAGGFQYCCSDPSRANTVVDFLMLENAKDYSIDRLSRKRRREVRVASKELVLRSLVDRGEFKDLAHPVYVSFYRRTHYGFLARRNRKEHFDEWADQIFAQSGLIVRGAFLGTQLLAVSISEVIDETLLYQTFFASDEGLRREVAGLMLHDIGTIAAADGQVERVLAGNRMLGALNTFYLLRGFRFVSKPAYLWLNPLAHFLLRTVAPRHLRHLRGETDPDDSHPG